MLRNGRDNVHLIGTGESIGAGETAQCGNGAGVVGTRTLEGVATLQDEFGAGEVNGEAYAAEHAAEPAVEVQKP